MIAEFESHPIRSPRREEMHVAKAKERLRGKQPKLSNTQQKHLMEELGSLHPCRALSAITDRSLGMSRSV